MRIAVTAHRRRPVDAGLCAEDGQLGEGAGRRGPVGYPDGAQRCAGATYDPVSHYRAARVLGFFADHGLTPALLRDAYQHQLGVLARGVDTLDVPDEVLARDRDVPLAALGGFLALRTPHAGWLTRALATRGVHADWRGDVLRLGPAPYLADAQLEAAVAALGDAVGELVGRLGGRRRASR